MSVLDGGIFSRPRGKTGGIVFGAARTRRGKQVTSRLLVPPSNPNTAAQQIQRGIFASTLDLIKRLGSAVYRTDWNRAVGQLPGFQSMQSLFMGQMDSEKNLTLINPINLGTLEVPASITISSDDSGTAIIEFPSAVVNNGTAADIVKVLAIAKTDAVRSTVKGVVTVLNGIRSNGQVDLAGLEPGETYEIYIYFVGVGTASGLLSVATPLSIAVTV